MSAWYKAGKLSSRSNQHRRIVVKIGEGHDDRSLQSVAFSDASDGSFNHDNSSSSRHCMLGRSLLRGFTTLSRPCLTARSFGNMAPSRSPSPPSKRTKLDQSVDMNGDTSHAMPSSSLTRPTSPGMDKDASMLPIPTPASPQASTSAAPAGNLATSKQPVKPKNKHKKKKKKPVESGGLEDIMFYEVKRLLSPDIVQAAVAGGQDYIEKFDHLEEVELEVVDMSSHGEGLAINDHKDWVVAVPFCVPGERVLAKVYRNVSLQ